jgi:beta-glucosidase
VLDLGKPVVVLLSSGRPLVGPWLFERAQAVLATWFLGSEAGHAVGEVLSGRWNPTGRLPVSWPVDVGQIPIFYAQRPTGRPPDPAVHYSSKYLDLPVEPLFPFGHGLSYTRFDLSNLRAGAAELRPGESITIECDVVNRGPVPGEETLLLFVRDPIASIARPLLELKGTTRIALEPGQKGSVRFTLAADDLTLLGPDLRPRLEPGNVELYVGRTAERDTSLKTSIRLLES